MNKTISKLDCSYIKILPCIIIKFAHIDIITPKSK